MKRFLIISLFLLNMLLLSAQIDGVSINRAGADPDSSAILDVQSTTKGMLVPRMDSSQRKAIGNPATGLLVFDLDTDGFWFYSGSDWTSLGSTTGDTVFATAFVGDGAGLTGVVIPVPDTAQPVPIRFEGGELLVHPIENATDVDWSTARATCSNLTAFGFSDWVLPSRVELNAMYKQSYLITGLNQTESAKYWSSTEQDLNHAFTQRLDYGGPDPDAKTDATGHNCRCIRRNP